MENHTNKKLLEAQRRKKIPTLMIIIMGIIVFGMLIVMADSFPAEYIKYIFNDAVDASGGSSTTANQMAQSFAIRNVSTFIKGIQVRISRTGSPELIDVKIYNTLNRLPTTSIGGNTTFNSSNLGTSAAWYNITLPDIPVINGTTYAIVFETTEEDTSVTWKSSTDVYANGSRLYKNGAGPWTEEGAEDFKFEIYGGDVTAVISMNVNLVSPLDSSTISTVGEVFNASYTTTHSNFTNATYYLWDSDGLFNETTVLTNGTINSTSLYIDEFVLGTYEWNVLTCAINTTSTVCTWAANNYTLNVGASITSESYSTHTYETSRETFNASLSLLPGTTLYDAQLYYDGVDYEGEIITNGSNYTITSVIDIPTISSGSSSKLKEWYWKLIYPLDGGAFIYQNLSSHNQNITSISLFNVNCSAGYNLSLNFSSYNEESLDKLDNFSFYGTFEYWLGGGDERKNISISNSSVSGEILFCINPHNHTFYSDTTIQYEKDKYIKRNYYLINSSLTNVTNEIGLYLLNTSSSTSFIINLIDDVQFPIANAYIYIQRYYPGTGRFQTVEMARTDDAGNTIGHFEAETEDYKIIVFKDGRILYESNVQKVFCGETPCTLSFQVQAEAPTVWETIGAVPNLIWSLTYNETTSIWTYTYVDISGTTNYGRLFVYTETGLGRNVICNVSDSSSAATLTCNVTNYNGTIYATSYISRSPEILVWLTSIIRTTLKGVFGMEGLFWATLILLTIGLIGLWNPSVGVVMMIVGVVVINFLSIAKLGLVTIMGIVIIGVVLLWEMKRP